MLIPYFRRALAAFLLLTMSLFSVNAAAAEEFVAPNMFYKNNLGSYASKSEGEADLRARFAQTTYAGYFDVTGLVEIGTSKLNEQHVAYSLEYRANATHPDPKPVTAGQYSSIHLTAECPAGSTQINSTPTGYDGRTVCKRIPPCNDKCYGNPITIGGVKKQEETDYIGPGLLAFKRTYRSDRQGWIHNYQYSAVNTGALSQEQYNSQPLLGCVMAISSVTGIQTCFFRTTRNLIVSADETYEFVVTRPDGSTTIFKGADYLPSVDVNDRLKRILDANGQVVEWQVYNAQKDSTEIYNREGKVTHIMMRDGQALTFTYSDETTPPLVARKPGLLIKVSDSTGRELKLNYNQYGWLGTVIDPANGRIEYAYDEESSVRPPGQNWGGNLTSVTYQDGKCRVYWYAEMENTSDRMQPFSLTGITDEEGNRYATFKYDWQNRAISTEHAGGVEKYSFIFLSNSTTVTDPLNVTKDNYFSNVANTYRSTSETMRFNGTLMERTSYHDSRGNVIESRNYTGTLTTYQYDPVRNLETKRTEGNYSRTITTEWHPTERLVARVAEPKRITTFTYFPNGQVNTKSVQATTDETGASGFSAPPSGAARRWTYTYNGNGKIHTVTGPRTDVLDRTTFDYDAQANLTAVTNALGHRTVLSNYDAHGRARRITDPNNLITDITYNPRGWMTHQKVTSGAIVQDTVYERDGMGQLTKVTFPDASYITYTYDAAHRLTDISDALGNNIHYTLDNVGNRLEELTKDPGGSLTRKITRVYNAMNRLEQVTGGMQ